MSVPERFKDRFRDYFPSQSWAPMPGTQHRSSPYSGLLGLRAHKAPLSSASESLCLGDTAGRLSGRRGTGTPFFLWAHHPGSVTPANNHLEVINGSPFSFPIPRTSLMHSQLASPPLQSQLQLHGAPPQSSCGSRVLPSPQRPELQLHGDHPSGLDFNNSTSFLCTLSCSSGAASCSSHLLHLSVSFLLFQSSNTSFTTFLHWILKIIKSGFHFPDRTLPNKPFNPMQLSTRTS